MISKSFGTDLYHIPFSRFNILQEPDGTVRAPITVTNLDSSNPSRTMFYGPDSRISGDSHHGKQRSLESSGQGNNLPEQDDPSCTSTLRFLA